MEGELNESETEEGEMKDSDVAEGEIKEEEEEWESLSDDEARKVNLKVCWRTSSNGYQNRVNYGFQIATIMNNVIFSDILSRISAMICKNTY